MVKNLKSWRKKWRRYKKDSYLRWSITISLIVLAGYFFLIFWFWNQFPKQIPLYYSLPWGEKQLADSFGFSFASFLFFGIYVVNIFLAGLVHTFSKFLSHMLIIGGTIILLLGLTTIVQIIFLIT